MLGETGRGERKEEGDESESGSEKQIITNMNKREAEE